jgi:integrase
VTGVGRQAKTLGDFQLRQLLAFVEAETAFPARNIAIVLASFLCGLRAKEIVSLRWRMLTDVEGHVGTSLALTNVASKGTSGRVLPLPEAMQRALNRLHEQERAVGRGEPEHYVVTFSHHSTDPAQRSGSVRWLLKSWYGKLGFEGASSHSGRRSFLTKAAREVGRLGGSLRDVMALAGHSSLQMTQRYIDTDPDVQKKLVATLWKLPESGMSNGTVPPPTTVQPKVEKPPQAGGRKRTKATVMVVDGIRVVDLGD